jgi:hypothetical protein
LLSIKKFQEKILSTTDFLHQVRQGRQANTSRFVVFANFCKNGLAAG